MVLGQSFSIFRGHRTVCTVLLRQSFAWPSAHCRTACVFPSFSLVRCAVGGLSPILAREERSAISTSYVLSVQNRTVIGWRCQGRICRAQARLKIGLEPLTMVLVERKITIRLLANGNPGLLFRQIQRSFSRISSVMPLLVDN